MNKLMMVSMFAAAVAMNVCAEEAQAPSAKEIAAQPAVEEMLLDDDGVAIVTAPDGSFQIFSCGTGLYNFNHPKALKDARTVARLTAQKHLAEFIKTKVTESTSYEDITKDCLAMAGDGTVQKQEMSKETAESLKKFMASHAEAILHGLVTVESKQKATPGTTTGEIQVKLVYSSKTSSAAQWYGKKNQDHQAELKLNEQLNEVKVEATVGAARRAAEDAAKQEASGRKESMVGSDAGAARENADKAWDPVQNNKDRRRVNKTEY